MQYEQLYSLALEIATEAHAGQRDLGGVDYIRHPVAVSEICHSKKAKVAALLHDVIEDTPVTAEDLRSRGIPDEIVEAVVLVSKTVDFEEEDYFTHIKGNPIAREVKMADLLHNLDPRRTVPPEKQAYVDEKRRRYYREFLYLYTDMAATGLLFAADEKA